MPGKNVPHQGPLGFGRTSKMERSLGLEPDATPAPNRYSIRASIDPANDRDTGNPGSYMRSKAKSNDPYNIPKKPTPGPGQYKTSFDYTSDRPLPACRMALPREPARDPASPRKMYTSPFCINCISPSR